MAGDAPARDGSAAVAPRLPDAGGLPAHPPAGGASGVPAEEGPGEGPGGASGVPAGAGGGPAQGALGVTQPLPPQHRRVLASSVRRAGPGIPGGGPWRRSPEHIPRLVARPSYLLR
jgi:hypothetical protein